MKIKDEHRVFTKALLIEANEASIREDRGRSIYPEILQKLHSHAMIHEIWSYIHKADEMRMEIQIGKNQTAFLDLSILRYESLPLIQYFEDGTYNIKFFKRPYPNGREWKETIKRVPIRKQFQFRKEVLAAYNNCCAVCDISDTSLLRAAHIMDVTEGGPDSIDNGILLCVNHETAFDSGILKINSDYTINAEDGIGVKLNKIKLPTKKKHYPSPYFFEKKIEIISRKKSHKNPNKSC